MTLEIGDWMRNYVDRVQKLFGERLVFVGLQGSRSRGEATEQSDIDVVLILDVLTMNDLNSYRALLDTLPERELICGFIAGKDELEFWDRADLFQFCHDTVPVIGDLYFVEEKLTAADARRAAHLGACNLYHGAIHNMLHGRSMEMLTGLYKGASFVLQAKHYCETDEYVRRKDDLLKKLSEEDAHILRNGMLLKQNADGDFDVLSEQLIAFASSIVRQYAEN